MAFAGVIRLICCDAADLLIGCYLIKKVGQHGRISNVATGHLDRTYLQRFFINPYMYLAPQTTFCAAMLASVPLTFSLNLDASTVDKEV